MSRLLSNIFTKLVGSADWVDDVLRVKYFAVFVFLGRSLYCRHNFEQ
jgi:hypothetical protein